MWDSRQQEDLLQQIAQQGAQRDMAQGTGVSIPAEDLTAQPLSMQPGLLGGTNMNAQAALQNIAADNAQQALSMQQGAQQDAAQMEAANNALQGRMAQQTQAAQRAGMQAMQQAQAEEAQRQQMLLKLAMHFFGV